VSATGGTNWKEYLPPSFQKVVFFPEIYTKQELNDWGKQWVDHIFNPEKSNKKNV
ncbi:MAG: tryptophan 2,3-dioxygenase, partial [Flavobacteriaceae bacterium]